MKTKPPLIRQTFLQERFCILIKKQKNGTASFADLTELDNIVNRDPAIRDSILEEMQEHHYPPHDPLQPEIIFLNGKKPASLLDRLKSFINRLFMKAAGDLKPVFGH